MCVLSSFAAWYSEMPAHIRGSAILKKIIAGRRHGQSWSPNTRIHSPIALCLAHIWCDPRLQLPHCLNKEVSEILRPSPVECVIREDRCASTSARRTPLNRFAETDERRARSGCLRVPLGCIGPTSICPRWYLQPGTTTLGYIPQRWAGHRPSLFRERGKDGGSQDTNPPPRHTVSNLWYISVFEFAQPARLGSHIFLLRATLLFPCRPPRIVAATGIQLEIFSAVTISSDIGTGGK